MVLSEQDLQIMLAVYVCLYVLAFYYIMHVKLHIQDNKPYNISY